MRKTIILLISFSVLFLIAANFFAPDIAIDWWAIGPSSQVMSAGSVQLTGMVGQAAAGELSAGGLSLCVGYLCVPISQELVDFLLYLPLILK